MQSTFANFQLLPTKSSFFYSQLFCPSRPQSWLSPSICHLCLYICTIDSPWRITKSWLTFPPWNSASLLSQLRWTWPSIPVTPPSSTATQGIHSACYIYTQHHTSPTAHTCALLSSRLCLLFQLYALNLLFLSPLLHSSCYSPVFPLFSLFLFVTWTLSCLIPPHVILIPSSSDCHLCWYYCFFSLNNHPWMLCNRERWACPPRGHAY